MEDKNIEIILFGECCVGKSSLGNFLLGKKVFKLDYENNHRPKTIELGRNNDISIIETFGFFEYNCDYDNDYLKEIFKYMQNSKNLKAILFLIDSINIRLKDILKNLIEIFCNVFPKKIFKNVAFVFTKFYYSKKMKLSIKTHSVEFIDQIKNIIDNFYGKGYEKYTYNSFFIDSDLEDSDNDSLREKEKIIEWAKELPRINTTEIFPRYKKIYESNTVESSRWEDYYYIYERDNYYTTIKGIDLNNNEIIIEPKRLISTKTTKIPKNHGCFVQ